MERKRKRKRRRKTKGVKRQQLQYQLIDGNMSYYPVAFCSRYDGWLTNAMIEVHGCRDKNGKCCCRFEEVFK